MLMLLFMMMMMMMMVVVYFLLSVYVANFVNRCKYLEIIHCNEDYVVLLSIINLYIHPESELAQTTRMMNL